MSLIGKCKMNEQSKQLKEEIIQAIDASNSTRVSELLARNKETPVTPADYEEIIDHISKVLNSKSAGLLERAPDSKFNTMQVVDLGDFKITSGRMLVTDPCYKLGTWCQGILESVRNGTWHAYVERKFLPQWDLRNWKIRVVHSQFPTSVPHIKMEIDVGVDSGKAGFFDWASYPEGDTDNNKAFDGFYEDICKLTLGDYGRNPDDFPQAGVCKFGAVSSSGLGDGSYVCYTAVEHNEIVAAEIVFLDENEDEAEESETDEENAS